MREGRSELLNISPMLIDILVFFCLYLIYSLSANLEFGYTGIANLGLIVPIILGAMVASVIPGRLAMAIYGLGDPLSIEFVKDNSRIMAKMRPALASDPMTSILLLIITLVAVIAVCSLAGYLCTLPALRLPKDYLALFMLGLGETLRILGSNIDWIAGGPYGISAVNFFWWTNSPFISTVFLIVCMSTASFIIYFLLCRSPLGRLLKSIRENEVTARHVGKRTSSAKIKAMMVSFAILGIGGALQTNYMGATVIRSYTRSDFSFWPWLMMIVGGTANVPGVFVGTFVLVIIRRIVIIFKHSFTFLPFSVVWIEGLLLAGMLILTLFLRPEGIFPEKNKRV